MIKIYPSAVFGPLNPAVVTFAKSFSTVAGKSETFSFTPASADDKCLLIFSGSPAHDIAVSVEHTDNVGDESKYSFTVPKTRTVAVAFDSAFLKKTNGSCRLTAVPPAGVALKDASFGIASVGIRQ